MSKAGIQSNRGDGYQTLVAFDWALTILSDPSYEWIEVDSAALPVDDVVIGKSDGTRICCQCKKNQVGFQSWTVGDLAEELRKADSLLAQEPNSLVRFYSRSPFGELAHLREFILTFPDEATYQASLGQGTRVIDAKLRQNLSHFSPFEFLRRTDFVTTEQLDRMQLLLHERLRRLVNNSSAAYDAIWTHLDHLGMRMSADDQVVNVQHRLRKGELVALLERSGALLSGSIDVDQVRESFEGTSAIGRAWRREIGNTRLLNSAVEALIAAIDAKHRSILLTGQPGAGKTCVMLELQEALEERARTERDILPLFIQTREFADITTVIEREAQGLSKRWVEDVARMAETVHVAVLVESLDVLSIAREHSVLTYFLAQIDRVLLVPNVSVIVACREFDRHYDRRIAQRNWDKIIECYPLDWSSQIAPLLAEQSIDPASIDSTTRELVKNPRELALFLDLAARRGASNEVTSQSLAMNYLASVLEGESGIGGAAIRVVEDIAKEMLNSRSVAVPRQRFTGSIEMLRRLLSSNILIETDLGMLAFGHQTLLDVLIVSGAMRRGLTLDAFIRDLPPVPFVRPSIRSFIRQLLSGDRRELRKQLRTVLSGSLPFHVRRLVAETFAELLPDPGDWLLLRDLRNNFRDVFQVIYTQAVRLEWHDFWLNQLIPHLKAERDAAGLSMHVNLIAQWKDVAPASVFGFWAEAMALDWSDKNQMSRNLEFALRDLSSASAPAAAPLVLSLMNLPRQEHSTLGRALARCIDAGAIEDALLWRYIAEGLSEADVRGYQLGQHLRCQPHEFGKDGDDFLARCMRRSDVLMDLVLASFERWSDLKRYDPSERGLWSGFLRDTSYMDSRQEQDFHHRDGVRILFDAVEASICSHARSHSNWWRSNRARLCFSHDGGLRYLAIVACIENFSLNLDIISRMLSDKESLESELAYDLGTLLNASYALLDTSAQDRIQEFILLMNSDSSDERPWIVLQQAQLIKAIPCYLRSEAATAVLEEVEKKCFPFVRAPAILGRGGFVRPPFTFQVFLDSGDLAVLELLSHYAGHVARSSFDDFLSGGAREVGVQLREAASRRPTRFLALLSEHWAVLSNDFCDDLLEGVADYLNRRFGNLQPNQDWMPDDESTGSEVASRVLDELERHPAHWYKNRAASSALQGCAHAVQSISDAGRVVFLSLGFASLGEESSVRGDNVDLVSRGINMMQGHIAEALMTLPSQLRGTNLQWPDTLGPALRRLAAHESLPIRAVVLRLLPRLQSHHPEIGWEMFALAMAGDTTGLWPVAETCLYYAYFQRFDVVTSWLKKLYREGSGRDLKTWGRISALAALSERTPLVQVIDDLNAKGDVEAWSGAASVWTHGGNLHAHAAPCVSAIEVGLSSSDPIAQSVARKLRRVFHEPTPPVMLPSRLVQRFFELLGSSDTHERDIYGFDGWLNSIATVDPEAALGAAEYYVTYAESRRVPVYDHANNFTQLLTRIFALAEEQEELDGGVMLGRTVAVQDAFLRLGVAGVNDWLRAAERL